VSIAARRRMLPAPKPGPGAKARCRSHGLGPHLPAAIERAPVARRAAARISRARRAPGGRQRRAGS
jgi:hypothetical protein